LWTFKIKFKKKIKKFKKFKNLKNFKKYILKKFKKSRSNKWQLVSIIINDLNNVRKKGPNWTKLTKIGTYLNTHKNYDWFEHGTKH